MNLTRNIFVLCLLATSAVGCRDSVDPGHLGRVKTPSGFSDELLEPGNHTCYGSDQMWQVETRDKTFEVPLNILLEKDQVNLGVTLSVTVGIDSSNKETVKPLFNKVQGKDNKISLQAVFNTYAARVCKSTPREFIRPKSVEQILASLGAIEDEIETAVILELKESPLTVRGISIVNVDFPEFITQAQEKAKQREIEIKEEESKALKELARLQGQKKQKQVERDIAVLEAQAIADSNRLIGESLSGEAGARFLQWHEIKVFGRAADGPNNTILLPTNLFQGGGLQPTFDLAPDGAIRKSGGGQ